MDSREKFLRTMRFEKVDRSLIWEFGYWAKTVRKWYLEGLPEIKGIPAAIGDGMTVTGEGIPFPEGDSPFAEDVSSFFKFDKGLFRIPVELGLFPPLKEKVLKENNKTLIVRTIWGATKEIYKDGSSVPRFSSFPLSDRNSFKELKEKFDPDDPGRFPKNWKELCRKYSKRDFPIVLGGHPYGLFGTLRYLMGFENFMVSFYDDPKLIYNIFEFLSDFWIEMYKKVLLDIKPDCVFFWEDMSYKNGSFVSPEIFRKFFKPNYKKLTDFLNNNDIDLIAVDTDGNCDGLIPLFIESGINIIWPFEVQAGMNIINVRKKFPGLGIAGGLNKITLSHDKGSIEKEIEGKLPFMLPRGGYIPYCDHLVQPEVPFSNFIYYRKKINEFITKYSH